MRAYLWSAFAVLAGLAVQAQVAPRLGNWGVDLNDQDRSVRPGDDFAKFQNGAWLARMQAATQPSSAYWRDVRIQAAQALSAELDQMTPGTPGKAAAFYRAAMDSAAAEAKGIAPFTPELNAIRNVVTSAQFARLAGAAEGPGTLRAPLVRRALGRGLFTLTIAPDGRGPAHYTVHLGQGGMMLPTPDYYTEPSFADLKTLYRRHVARMLTLIGWPDAEANADRIVALETRIAAKHVEPANGAEGSRAFSIARLAVLAPGFDWRAFLDGSGLANVDRVLPDSPEGVAATASIVAQTPLTVLQARQAYASAEVAAPLLNAALHDESAAFQAKVFQGLQPNPPRAFEAEKWLEASLPDALGELYAAHSASPTIKRRVAEIAAQLRAAMDLRLQRLGWMSPAARAMARRRLAQMQFHIGYPDQFDE